MKLVNLNVLGEVDHTKVRAPYVRASEVNATYGVTVYDIRFTQPNHEFLDTDILHSIEHMLATRFKLILGDQFLNFGLMGCQTGFYLTVATNLDIGVTIEKAIEQSLTLNEVPLCNEFQCGNFRNHNLTGAKQALEDFLRKKNEWEHVF